ncbi:hypothetical protein IQ269_08440 [Tychonema sp. LEGE 07199]|uniref:immunity protein TriTu family protein n=1 Tax=unclassified Tychonema TaxID=2642144 RepID=UPI0018819195|nr:MULTISPECIES: hypothetical protein [unclassified Tychonema]MBE9120846.1 hypothetical protein [Tychonema sp. LEGE 07199]MBE9135269.1 hypothetical protein [Tychonema sp. LEGE 07196]
MLDKFESWIQDKRQEIENWGYQLEIVKSPSDVAQQSLRLDLDSDNYIARITLWESGDSQLEIIDVVSEKMVFDEYLKIQANFNFSKACENLFNILNLNIC